MNKSWNHKVNQSEVREIIFSKSGRKKMHHSHQETWGTFSPLQPVVVVFVVENYISTSQSDNNSTPL